MNLYELQARFQQLMDKEELTDEECQELESLHTDIQEKCINRAKYIRNLEAELSAVSGAKAEMADRESRLKDKIAKRKEELGLLMETNHLPRITTPEFPIVFKRNPDSVVIDNEKVIPDNVMAVKITEKITPDKNKIKALLQSGTEVPGCHLTNTIKISFK